MSLERDSGWGGLGDIENHGMSLGFSRHMHILLQLVFKLSQCIREHQRQETGIGKPWEKRELMCEYWPCGRPCVDAGGKKELSSCGLPELKRGSVLGEYPKMGQTNEFFDSGPDQLTIHLDCVKCKGRNEGTIRRTEAASS